MVAMHVLSAAEMQACDRATTERFGIPSIQLMRAASLAVAAFVREQFPNAQRVTVLCGRGNNGGDGMMTARLLADAGLAVTTLLLGAPEQLAGDAAVNFQEGEFGNDDLGLEGGGFDDVIEDGTLRADGGEDLLLHGGGRGGGERREGLGVIEEG